MPFEMGSVFLKMEVRSMSEISIIPQPVRLLPQEGQYIITQQTPIIAGGAAAKAADLFCQMLNPASGFTLKPELCCESGVAFRLDAALAYLGSEGYRLLVTPRGIEASAPKTAGLLYAAQTLRQLLPAEVYSTAPVVGVVWSVPCVEIEDYPRFAWRGAMLDVCRHFFSKEYVLRFIDALAMHKMNTFHWHLTDDQGWRIEIKQYPKLTEVGGWRKETIAGFHDEKHEKPFFDGKPHGGFYTQDEAREVVAYAQARGINVVPEIEMPGHAMAAIAAYPELGNTGKQIEVCTSFGVNSDVFNVEESTIVFMQNVLDEIMAVFPSPFIHVGGDECPKDFWKQSPQAQARMKELGLKDEDELQSYFIGRMDRYLTEHGRRLIGWDEILEGGLAPNATVMSWRGEAGGIAAANADHDVVMASTNYTYLDYYQSEDHKKEPLAIGGYVPLEKVYSFEPVAAGIDDQHARHVLGAQGQIWTEFIAETAHLDYMAYPRLSALAEVTWTPREGKDFKAFSERLKAHLKRLDCAGVKYRKPDTI
jgi:hexosaminidase